jgi:hypothetical protein
VHDLDRDIVVGLLSKLFELISYVLNLTTTHKLILRERVGAEKLFSWCGQSFQEIEAQSCFES